MLSAWSRLYFVVVALVGLVTGVTLLVAPGATADYFVWSITPPLTAAFIGAGYLGTGLTLLATLSRERRWRHVRVLVPSIAAFALLTLLATLVHADRFHWDRAVTWAWVIVYAFVVVGAVALRLGEGRRLPPESALPLSRIERLGVLTAGGLAAAWSILLFTTPAVGSALWPWALTPLTGRVVAAWVAVGALVGLIGGLHRDAVALRLPLAGWAFTVMLFIFAVALRAAELTGAPSTATLFFASLGASVLGAVWLWLRLTRRLRAMSGGHAVVADRAP